LSVVFTVTMTMIMIMIELTTGPVRTERVAGALRLDKDVGLSERAKTV